MVTWDMLNDDDDLESHGAKGVTIVEYD